jgi:hypothetical protein
MSKRKEKKRKIHVLSGFFSTRVILILIGVTDIIGRAAGRVTMVIGEVTVLIPRCALVLDECEGLSCKVLSRLRRSCIGVEVW